MYLLSYAWNWVLHNDGTNLHIMGKLPLTQSISYCFCRIPWPWNIGFVTLFDRFGHILADLCLQNEFCIMAKLIRILCKMLKGFWLDQFQIAFIVFPGHEKIGCVILFKRFGHVLPELYWKKRALHNGETNLHITGIPPQTLSTFNCFCLNPWPWKQRFCHLFGQFWSCIYWVMLKIQVLHNGGTNLHIMQNA